MNYKKRIIQIILMIMILGLPTYGCAIRSMIKGRVVDAETGKPIEGAAILISWVRPSFGIPGLAGRTNIETFETTSDTKGYFRIPKNSGLLDYEYYLTIYKKGYVCWSNREIFPSHEKRGDVPLKNDMAIEMERFKEEYDKLDHARFVDTYSVATYRLKKPSVFVEAIKEENFLLDESAKREHNEWEDKKREK